jgi:hypothetical protein
VVSVGRLRGRDALLSTRLRTLRLMYAARVDA